MIVIGVGLYTKLVLLLNKNHCPLLEYITYTCPQNVFCIQEISVLPSDTNCYRTVGRTFVLVDKDDMCRELEQSIKDNEEYQKTSKDKQLYLEKQVKDREAELRELLEQAPRLAQAIAGGQR